jgi:hypothetical protein
MTMIVHQWKKIIGFFLIISIIVALLQLSSMVVKKQYNHREMIDLGKGSTFMPATEHHEKKIDQNSTDEQQTLPIKTTAKKAPSKLSEQEKKTLTDKKSLSEKKLQPKKQLEKTVNENAESMNKRDDSTISKSTQHQKTGTLKSSKNERISKSGLSERKNSHKPSNQKGVQTISLSDTQFFKLDIKRDEVIENSRQSNKKEGLYGWGILSDYKNPDFAHRVLGGIPFAINTTAKQYYKINLSESSIQPAFAMSSYGATGVEANDPQLHNIAQKGFQQGVVKIPHQQLSYYYLFSLDTETYINSKVVNAFEWYLENMNKKAIDSEHFRKEARLRIGVWQAKRQTGGQMGIVIPVYFDYQHERLFLPSSFYHDDYETACLNIHINKKDYQ